jgi:osmotically-inducible protein OsmY
MSIQPKRLPAICVIAIGLSGMHVLVADQDQGSDLWSDAESQLAELIARNTSDVRDVRNQLTVKGSTETVTDKAEKPPVRPRMRSVTAGFTTKVKSALLYDRNADVGGVDVSTKDGVVTLKGTVDSEAHKRIAIDIAKGIRGVKDINAILKVAS